MSRIIRYIVIGIIVTALPVFAQQSQGGMPGMGMQNPYPNQAPFSEPELTRFMHDWPDVVKWLDSHGKSLSDPSRPGAFAQAFAGADFAGYLGSKGWKVERFGFVTAEVARCMVALELQNQMPTANSQIEDSINQIQSNPDMTDAQKQAAIQQMRAVQSQMSGLSVNVPASELSLVKPRKDQLTKILDIKSSQD